MRAFDPPMVIVTTASGVRRGGCLVGFHGQAGIDPPRYAVRLSKANHTYRVALFATHLAVHAIDRADDDLAELFGGTSGDETDKFGRCEWTPGPGGVPLLDRVTSRMVLRIVSRSDDDGDHVAFSGEVVEAVAAAGLTPYRVSDADSMDAGHPSTDRPIPNDLTARRD